MFNFFNGSTKRSKGKFYSFSDPVWYRKSRETNTVTVDAATFIRLYERDPNRLLNARVIIPKLGSDDFGRFEIPLNPYGFDEFNLESE